MRTWITSDQHFGHKNIIDYCSRPFTNVDEMANTLIKNWNNVVGKNDLVFCLGDFSLKIENLEPLVSSLNGRKILIQGNHDAKGPDKFLRAGFERVMNCPIIIENGTIILSHKPIESPTPFYNIHGHCHWDSKTDIDNNHYDASTDRTNFTPVLLSEIIREKSWNTNE